MARRISSTARLMQFVHYQNKRPVGCPSEYWSYLLIDSVCSRTDRYMQDNSLHFWAAFVHEYFAPGAHMRVTLNGSRPANPGAPAYEAQSLGQAPANVSLLKFLSTTDSALLCSLHIIVYICYVLTAEAPLEVLPRLFHIKYDSGLKEELLYLSDPQEIETPSGKHKVALLQL